ncbi:hypothetical protein BDR07DRAFT_1443557 [Suillus spraguei]|nr:hypothetical protein BDR07DRAFT_1443557 [Suillus spraguei]
MNDNSTFSYHTPGCRLHRCSISRAHTSTCKALLVHTPHAERMRTMMPTRTVRQQSCMTQCSACELRMYVRLRSHAEDSAQRGDWWRCD